MPRTRIRAKAPLSVNTGGGTGGTGTNPAGSSLTTEDAGFIEIVLNEASATPTDAATFALAVTAAEAAAATPTEGAIFDVSGINDAPATPTGAHSETLDIGATTVTQTVGTGWTNPANAQGLSDGSSASINAPAALGGATVSGTLVGVYASIGTPSNETQTGTVTLAFTGSVTIGILATGSMQLAYSTDSGSNYTVLQTITATTATLPSFTITGVTLSTVSALRFRVVNTHTPSATGASGATLNSVVATFTATGNNAG